MRGTGRGLIDEIGAGVQNELVKNGFKYLTVSAHDATAVAAGGAQTVNLGLIPYSRWRVVAFGFVVTVAGTSAKLEHTDFGMLLGDVGDADADNIGKVVMEITGGDEYAAGDMVMKTYVEQGYYNTRGERDSAGKYGLVAPDVVANAVAPAIHVGTEFGKWQTKMTYIQVTNTGETNSTAQMIPFVVIEVGKLNTPVG